MWLRLSSFNGRPHLYFFLIVPSLQISCFGKTKEKQYAKYYLNKRIAARLIWQLVIHSCVIFAYIISRRDGENNGFLAGVSLPLFLLARPSRFPRAQNPLSLPFQTPATQASGFRIPWAVFRFPKPRIPDSTNKNFLDSGFHKQNFLGFRNPDFLRWGYINLLSVFFRLLNVLFVFCIIHWIHFQ